MLGRASITLMVVLAAACNSAGGSTQDSEVLARHPLASSEISIGEETPSVIKKMKNFAEEEGFAIKVKSLGRSDEHLFHATLFRDDLMVTVATPFKSNQLNISVFPLCACELPSLPHLPASARGVRDRIKDRLLTTGDVTPN